MSWLLYKISHLPNRQAPGHLSAMVGMCGWMGGCSGGRGKDQMFHKICPRCCWPSSSVSFLLCLLCSPRRRGGDSQSTYGEGNHLGQWSNQWINGQCHPFHGLQCNPMLGSNPVSPNGLGSHTLLDSPLLRETGELSNNSEGKGFVFVS